MKWEWWERTTKTEQKEKQKKTQHIKRIPRPGIEPGSSAWQAEILGDHDLHVLGSTYMFWEKHDLHVYGGKLTCLWIFRLTHLQAKKFFLHKKNFSSEKARSKKKFFFLPVKNFLWRPLAKFLCLCAKCFTLSPWGRILMVFTHIT